MGDTWVTRLSDLPAPGESLPPGLEPARRIAGHLGLIAAFASMVMPNAPIDTPIRCRRRPAHRPCPGHIRVRRSTEDDRIRWACSDCADNGLIWGWRETAWDYSMVAFEE